MDIGVLFMAVLPPTEVARRGPLDGRSDSEIIRAILDGDSNASEELVRRYWNDCARAALIVIGDQGYAEDAAQEAFISALGALKKFDQNRPFAPWLHRIVVNKAIDRARKPDYSREEPVGEMPSPNPVLKLEAGSDDLGARVIEIVGGLDPLDRAMLVARHVLGYRAVEIAEWLDIPAATVRVRIHRASIRVQLLVEEGKGDAGDD